MRAAYLATSERLAALTGQQGFVKDPEAPQQHEVTLHSNAPPTHHATWRERGEVEQRRKRGKDGDTTLHMVDVWHWAALGRHGTSLEKSVFLRTPRRDSFKATLYRRRG